MHLSSFSDPPPPFPPPSTSSRNTTRKGSPIRILPEKKCTEERFSKIFNKKEKIRDRHVRTGMSLSNISHARIPLCFFSFPFRSGKGDGWAGYQFLSSSGKKCSCSWASKKGEGEKRKQCQTRSQPPFHFPPPPSPCHSFPSHPQSLLAEHFLPSPPSFGPVSSSPPPPPPLFPYRGVNRMRYSRLGEREETEEEDRRWMDGRGGDGRKWKNHQLYTGRNNLQLVLK